MLTITPPPPPQLAMAPTLGIAALGVIVGGALVLWGRVLNRSFLAAVGAAAGVVLADRLARQFGLPAFIVVDIGGQTFPIVWAIVGAAILSAILGFLFRRRAYYAQ